MVDGKPVNLLVCLVGDSIDLRAIVNGRHYPLKTMEWEINGKVEKVGKLLMEENFMIENITEEMDGTNVSLHYEIFTKTHKSYPSWTPFKAEAKLSVFKLTILASKQVCMTGEGDLLLIFKQATQNRKKDRRKVSPLGKKIKLIIEDLTGSNKIKSLNSGYSVTLPFDKVRHMKKVFDMKPTLEIDGAHNDSCPLFVEAPKTAKKGLTEATQMGIDVNIVNSSVEFEPVDASAHMLPTPHDHSQHQGSLTADHPCDQTDVNHANPDHDGDYDVIIAVFIFFIIILVLIIAGLICHQYKPCLTNDCRGEDHVLQKVAKPVRGMGCRPRTRTWPGKTGEFQRMEV
eukprot:GFUD01010126.1.p1 GENE.GFUD01010126.1~~GFUD01010126.1.p1  ORF type:complete len:402 (-),score=65.04 GFUD01010126.1:368-1396(-)